jgi:hypothetical protein
MNKRLFSANIKNAFGWKFINVPKSYGEDFFLTNEKLNQLQSDINIGFEKDQREIILKHLEGLARKNVTIDLQIPLDETPKDSPHHLDNENEIIEYDKLSFKKLIISRIESGCTIEILDKTIKLNLDYNGITNLFTRLYVCMELYATIYDNILVLENENKSEIRLVIWGVYNGKPIHY